MRRFLRKYVWFWVASSISLFGCSNGAKKEVVNDKSPESEKEMKVASGVRTSYLKEGVSVTWIQDNAQDKLMPLSLFADVPDSIIDNLSLRGGIPSSISTFLVEISGTRILFDTGIGVPNGRLLDGLKAMGLNPADIQYVYLLLIYVG